MADININEVYEELKYLGDLPETSRLIKDYLVLREENETLRTLVGKLADIVDGPLCIKTARVVRLTLSARTPRTRRGK